MSLTNGDSPSKIIVFFAGFKAKEKQEEQERQKQEVTGKEH